MEIQFQPGRKRDQVIIVLEGDLDLYATVAFCNAVLSKLESGTTRAILDFGKVRYLDSSGVGALIRILQKARSLGGEIRVVRLAGTPMKVLEMSNIISLLKISPDTEAALEAWE